MRISKGYYGYHITWFGEKVFLRSRSEYIVALYLDQCKIYYQVEPYGKFEKYRPDFVIENKKCIIEVKASVKDKNRCINERLQYYRKAGYRVIILGNYWHFTWLKKRIDNIESLLEQWKIQDRFTITMEGKNNPRFGIPCSLATKQTIGRKAKERNKDLEYRKANSVRMLAFYETEEGKQQKQKLSDVRKKARIISSTNCIICDEPFEVEIIEGNESNIRKTCSSKCRAKYYSLLVKEGKIVLPPVNVRKANRGVLVRTLNQWVKKADLTVKDLKTQKDFDIYLTKSKECGKISKRTMMLNVEQFYQMFSSKKTLFKIIGEYNDYGKVDFEKYGL